MIFAAIDIGSNASRLLFANAHLNKGKIMVSKSTLVRIPTRLGLDVYPENVISNDRKEVLFNTLKGYKLLMEAYQPVAYDACATAAMRDAENGAEIISYIKNQIGLNIRIIDGLEEAKIIRKTNQIIAPDDGKAKMMIDVGGGSTDISISLNHQVVEVESFKIGTIRLMKDLVKEKEWKKLEKWLRNQQSTYGSFHLIGSGGNINKINKIFGDPAHFILSGKKLKEAYNILKNMSVEQRMNTFGMRTDRADVIVHAARIFRYIFKRLEAEIIYVPKIGLADGLIYQMYEKHLKTLSKDA